VVVFESRGVLVGSGEGGYYVGYLDKVSQEWTWRRMILGKRVLTTPSAKERTGTPDNEWSTKNARPPELFGEKSPSEYIILNDIPLELRLKPLTTKS
jgi:hypothetical protein